MLKRRLHFPALLFLAGSPALLLTGCHSHTAAATNAPEVRAAHRAELDAERAQLELILPPSKNRYMAIHTFDAWENPYITVQPGMLELHVTIADTAPQSFGTGGMLRPIGARRQVVDISFDKLGEAMAAVPQTSWPYGRVVAIEEAHNTPKAGEPVVRRNMETAIGTLNDLGIEVYDIHDGNLR